MIIPFKLETFEGTIKDVKAVRIFLSTVHEMNSSGAGTSSHSILSVVEERGVTKSFPINSFNKLILVKYFPYINTILDTPDIALRVQSIQMGGYS